MYNYDKYVITTCHTHLPRLSAIKLCIESLYSILFLGLSKIIFLPFSFSPFHILKGCDDLNRKSRGSETGPSAFIFILFECSLQYVIRFYSLCHIRYYCNTSQ